MKPPARRRAVACAVAAVAAWAWCGVRPAGADAEEVPEDMSTIRSDERVDLYPSAGRLSGDGTRWIVALHGRIYEPADSFVRLALARKALERLLGAPVPPGKEATFASRANLFFADNERGKRIGVELAGKVHVLPASDPGGHFSGEVEVPREEAERHARDGVLPVRAVTAADDPREFTGRVHLVPPCGTSVVSDIDDTVKVTGVGRPRRLLRRTFLEEFEAVPGMAARYRAWAERDVAFHFVSSSPWQLWEPLEAFLERESFPGATVHLKRVRLTDASIFDLFAPGTETKPPAIRSLLEAWPERRFVLVGDTGEEDAQVYGSLVREFPGRIERVYLRNTTEARREDERLRRAFEGVDPERWRLFTDPGALDLPEAAATEDGSASGPAAGAAGAGTGPDTTGSSDAGGPPES